MLAPARFSCYGGDIRLPQASSPEVSIMPRLPRLLLPDSPIVYHVISKTALDGLPFDEVDKDDFVRRLKHLARVYFTEMLGFCMMDNHFHILLCMFPADHVSDADLEQRYRVRYGEKSVFPAPKSQELRRKWSSLSEFSKERVERKLKEKMPERKERSPHAFNGLSGLCTLKRLAPG